jgi:hypothetical protein
LGSDDLQNDITHKLLIKIRSALICDVVGTRRWQVCQPGADDLEKISIASKQGIGCLMNFLL